MNRLTAFVFAFAIMVLGLSSCAQRQADTDRNVTESTAEITTVLDTNEPEISQTTEGTVTDIPVTNDPYTEPPVTSAPSTDRLETEAPAPEAPTTDAPETARPETEAPLTEKPATEPPATQPPATQPPATQPPATQPPATQPPATQPPATQPPATQQPATQPPVTQPPATQPPATQPPATECSHDSCSSRVTPPSCEEDGQCLFQCNDCFESWSETLPATGHDYTVTETAATCVKNGSKTTVCGNCGDKKVEVIPAIGHSYATSVTDPTCGYEGSEISVCVNCSDTVVKVIPRLEHEYVTNIIDPTCIYDGSKTTTCSFCGNQEYETIPALGHDLTTRVTLEATCTDTGIIETSCSRCEYVYSDIIYPEGHNYVTTEVAATCYEDGSRTHTCSVCGDTVVETIYSYGHSYTYDYIEPTCEKDGSYSVVCSVCGEGTVEVYDAYGHNYEFEITVAPTPTVEGKVTYTCSRCGDSYEKNIGTFSFDPTAHGDPHRIVTSNNKSNYVDFSISGNTLTIQGKIQMEGLQKLWIFIGHHSSNGSNTVISASDGELFVCEMPLDGITDRIDVSIYTNVGGSSYTSYIWDEIFVSPKDGGYVFEQSLVLEHNIEMMEQWADPDAFLDDNISETIKKLSDDIVGDETDTYKKMFLLHKWVADNIYYDYDYYYGRSDEIFLSAEDVYLNRRSVCSGYATLLGRLIQAQGIPCMLVTTYSTGVSTSGSFNQDNYLTTSSNHAHVEAYLEEEGRWVTMDPTWDSGNTYENGEFISDGSTLKWFDISLDMMSFTHKILERAEQFYW